MTNKLALVSLSSCSTLWVIHTTQSYNDLILSLTKKEIDIKLKKKLG